MTHMNGQIKFFSFPLEKFLYTLNYSITHSSISFLNTTCITIKNNPAQSKNKQTPATAIKTSMIFFFIESKSSLWLFLENLAYYSTFVKVSFALLIFLKRLISYRNSHQILAVLLYI